MTKVSIYGKDFVNSLKPIEFVKFFDGSEVGEAEIPPSNYQFIDLVAKNYHDGMDLILAYREENERGNGVLYIGYFNDGFVK